MIRSSRKGSICVCIYSSRWNFGWSDAMSRRLYRPDLNGWYLHRGVRKRCSMNHLFSVTRCRGLSLWKSWTQPIKFLNTPLNQALYWTSGNLSVPDNVVASCQTGGNANGEVAGRHLVLLLLSRNERKQWEKMASEKFPRSLWKTTIRLCVVKDRPENLFLWNSAIWSEPNLEVFIHVFWDKRCWEHPIVELDESSGYMRSEFVHPYPLSPVVPFLGNIQNLFRRRNSEQPFSL